MSAKVVLIGRLGQDPQTKQAGNSSMVTFSVGVRTSQKSKDGYISNWYDCTVWGQTGERVMQYCKKGSQVVVIGDLALADYQAKDGSTKYSLRVNANSVDFVGGGTGSGATATSAPAKQTAARAPQQEEDDSDLPF